jgi:hypothetical protein
MGKKIIYLVFFGNYFIGLLAIALSLETSFQLRLPVNSAAYYVLLFCSTVFYYTFAYTNGINQAAAYANPRTNWYARHTTFTRLSQLALAAAGLTAGAYFFYTNARHLSYLTVPMLLLFALTGTCALLYYGLLPASFFRLNLRNTGLLKAFIIGFVWACTVGLLPVAILQLEKGACFTDPVLLAWLFIKNWMFCTVNAILFDLKDYATDANRQLKTFVVQFGLRRTIFFLLIPLLFTGIAALLLFTRYRHFTLLPVLINLLPFLLLLYIAYSMHRRKNILYYLIVIDGALLVKAVCGILAMQFVPE